jgi:hypothetical protein
MAPITIRLLGAPAPKTDAGTIAGRARAAPDVVAATFKNCLRVVKPFLLIILS